MLGIAAVASTTTALAPQRGRLWTRLTGFQEVPAISTEAGKFRAKLRTSSQEIRYEPSYADLTGAVQQAHIHIGQRSVNGGISVFLCSNSFGNGLAGTQACSLRARDDQRDDQSLMWSALPTRASIRWSSTSWWARSVRAWRMPTSMRDLPDRRDPWLAARLSELREGEAPQAGSSSTTISARALSSTPSPGPDGTRSVLLDSALQRLRQRRVEQLERRESAGQLQVLRRCELQRGGGDALPVERAR